MADVVPAFADGRIKPVVDRVFPFEQLRQAKAHMEANRHLGKIVLAMPASLELGRCGLIGGYATH